MREWRRFNKNVSEQYSYLLELGPERLENIFANEIGFGLLGEFLITFNSGFDAKDFEAILTILDHLKNTGRFALTVQFLSSKEKHNSEELFLKCEEWFQNVGNEDKEKFRNLLDNLRKVYEIK